MHRCTIGPMLRFLHRPHLGFCLVVACTAPLYKDTNLTKESDLGGSASARFQRFEGKVGIALAVARRVSQSQMNRRDKSRRAKGELLSAVGVRLKSTKIRDWGTVRCFMFFVWCMGSDYRADQRERGIPGETTGICANRYWGTPAAEALDRPDVEHALACPGS